MKMKPNRLLTLLTLWAFVLPVQANESLFTYDQFQDDLDIRSVEAHDQSRIWSTCAVVHELVAMMDDNGPDSASAKQSANQGNGAKLASCIVFIVDYSEETHAPDPAAFVLPVLTSVASSTPPASSRTALPAMMVSSLT